METWVRKERIYSGNVFDVLVGEARMEDGAVVPREMVDHPGGVAVVPVCGEYAVLVRQYRIAIGSDILEIPAGKLESNEESPEHRGRCELEEETGYRAGALLPLSPIFPSVGYTSEKIHMFLAFDLEKTEQRLEFDERTEPVLVPLAELPTRLAAGEFPDAKTYIGLRMLLDYLDSQH